MKYMRQAGSATLAGIMMLLLIVVAIIGYVMNIAALFKAGAIGTWAAVEVFRVIGIFIPFIGAVMGWF